MKVLEMTAVRSKTTITARTDRGEGMMARNEKGEEMMIIGMIMITGQWKDQQQEERQQQDLPEKDKGKENKPSPACLNLNLLREDGVGKKTRKKCME